MMEYFKRKSRGSNVWHQKFRGFPAVYPLNIPPGGKLNPRYVCSWRSYDRHWMPNAWFWHTFQLMTFAVPVCFGFFLAFCNVFCIHELAKSASFFCIFLQFFQVLAHFCAPYFLSPRMQSTCHPDWTVSFKTLAVFWNKQAPVFSHLYCQRRKSWLTTQATGRYYTSPQPPPKPTRKHPKKRQYTKVTTVLPLEGRRHQKHAMRSKEQTVNEPISFSWWSLRVENLSCKPLLLT